MAIESDLQVIHDYNRGVYGFTNMCDTIKISSRKSKARRTVLIRIFYFLRIGDKYFGIIAVILHRKAEV